MVYQFLYPSLTTYTDRLPSVKDRRGDRILRQTTIVLGGDDHHSPLAVSDEDELGVGASTTNGGNSADEVPGSGRRTGRKVAGRTVTKARGIT